MVRQWNELYEWPKLKTATISEFFEILEADHSGELPVYRAAWPDWWTDGYATDWNTVQNFASVRNSSAQILMASDRIPLMQFGGINTGRYQYGAKPAKTHIYGWPMNNYWTTNFNADQRGELTFTYPLTSAADTSNLKATRFGWGYRIPLLARVLPPGQSNGQEPEASFLSIEPDNLLLINAKPVPSDHSVILQVREVAGRGAEIKAKGERRKN